MWKVSKCGVFSGPYSSVFEPEKTVFEHVSRSDIYKYLHANEPKIRVNICKLKKKKGKLK